MHDKKIFEYAVLSCIRKHGNSVCISDIASYVGMGIPEAKKLVFKLVSENKVDVCVGKTKKNYSTWFFYMKSVGR